MTLHNLILDSLMNQIISGVHPSNIIHETEMVEALTLHPLFSSIVADMDNRSDLFKKDTNLSLAKQSSKRYPKYYFTEDALKVLQNFYDFMDQKFPTRKALEKRFPLSGKYISQIYFQPKDTQITKFNPKQIEIDLSKPLYHTTNAFEIFEMKDVGTPFGPAWFTIDEIFDPENVKDFHPKRGGMRVIKYKWNFLPEIDLEKEFPFVDAKVKLAPKIMDARKLKKIPAGAIETYFSDQGMILTLPKPDLDQNILMVYGKTWRPFLVKYLTDKGYDGILTKQNELVLFRPERWLTFENIEQGDMLYSAVIETLKQRNKFKIPEIASQNKVDPQSLMILYNKNLENIPV